MTSTLEPTSAGPVADKAAIYLAGRWQEPVAGEQITVVNPATGSPVAKLAAAGIDEADRAVVAAREALDSGVWADRDATERAATLVAIADALDARTDSLVSVLIADLGLPRSFAEFVNQTAAQIWRDVADLATELRTEEVRTGAGYKTLIRREPVGVVAAIVPFNAPTALAAAKIAPALLAGCSVVVKADPYTPLASYILAEVFDEVGLPPGVISVLPAGREVGAHLVAHPGVDFVSFTGSTVSGRAVMKSAADHMARMTLELGGKSAAVILDDADPAAVLPMLVPLALGQSSQVCTALTRLLVSEENHDMWAELLAGAFASLPVGDPASPDTVIGPLVNADAVTRCERFVAEAVEEGATVLTGGERLSLPGMENGYFFAPTLLDGVRPDSTVAQNEVFGPVISLITYTDVDDAVRIANGTDFGLAAAVFGTDVDRALGLADRLDAGVVAVNTPGTAMAQPFGGYKQSGIGREGGPEGLDHFFEVKQIRVPE
ncbi:MULTISPECIES: aldehyde dehydrogenase family protein [Gordonia]|uniref:aldehyde dehydrogenase family protein n=1 Tax=Gordonia TaxID=2053 RepID=UPI0012BB3107|nr:MULTISPECIES: aldehyde dehydrogenase family protein [Gordonia]MDH3008764.1 aldehyde dehydrogenase family protein [Gordonia alkanivorans]MDH3012621.1 aldehyde dehydrogenase family protein [Gordonia alkanivorans]MDH3017667.1 aldehyde dehydrogenase family protein [Gordonia alkanivorans]MDH3025945.1 aldehyde dehydrogenase family protein [Gordonia alkanivorans]MDH3043037.1 aldehyde dehydrogenase family protein [Gordonia alkanivorans]